MKTKLERAAMRLSKSWAAWLNHSDCMPSQGIVEGVSALMDALKVDVSDNNKAGVYRLVKLQPKRKMKK